MRLALYVLLFFSLVSQAQGTITLTDSDIKAFPTAIGFGKNVDAGRGGSVVFVINRNSSGPGSLEYAIENVTGNRTIIFQVSGTITLTDNLTIPDDGGDVYIAGQTAPEGGITIAGQQLQIRGDNTIVRFIRSRPGENATGDDGIRVTSDAGAKSGLIIDHCSVSWGVDAGIDIGGIVYNSGNGWSDVTIQNTIIAENLVNGYGMLLWRETDSISIIKNLFAHNVDRNIRASTQNTSFEFINNLIYNYESGTDPTYENVFDFIGNTYLTGDLTPNTYTLELNSCSATNCPDGANIALTRAYVSDNNIDGGALTVNPNINPYLEGSRILGGDYTPIDDELVESTVLNDVGMTLYEDTYDAKIKNEVATRTGTRHTTVAAAGGYPTIPDNTPYQDDDGDGLSNEYEIANGGGPTGISPNTRPSTASLVNGATIDQSGVTNFATAGYTHMDIFLSELAGDWDSFTASGGTGGGSSTPDSKKNETSAMLIAH